MLLPKDVKKKWVEALRSGDYRQTVGTMYNPSVDGYCCLGVLEHCITGEVEKYEGFVGSASYQEAPTPKFWDKVNAQSYYLSVDKLMEMNDGEGEYNGNVKSFDEIADWIEANVNEYEPNAG